ncbi:MAG: inner membrane CreD family protein, partial [Pseudomonadota bacterium]
MSDVPPASARPFAAALPHRSAGLKLLLVCALALAMTIPALFVYGVVKERTSGEARARADVAMRTGGAQAALGPFLAVPYAIETEGKDGEARTRRGVAIAFAETGAAESRVDVEERKRGIYVVPIFTADIKFEATFNPQALRDALPEDAAADWAEARLYLGVSDNR